MEMEDCKELILWLCFWIHSLFLFHFHAENIHLCILISGINCFFAFSQTLMVEAQDLKTSNKIFITDIKMYTCSQHKNEEEKFVTPNNVCFVRMMWIKKMN